MSEYKAMNEITEEAKKFISTPIETVSDKNIRQVCAIADGHIQALIKGLEQHKAITEAAKFLVKVKRHKDTGGAWYSASWPIALRKIEEAVDNLGEDNE